MRREWGGSYFHFAQSDLQQFAGYFIAIKDFRYLSNFFFFQVLTMVYQM